MSAQAGWYPDPSGDTTRLRYWDGTQWTDGYLPVQQVAASTGADGSQQTAQQPEVVTPPQTTSSAGGYWQTPDGYATVSVSTPGDTNKTLRLVAFIFCLICAISVCWLIIPLAWMIPMTVHAWGIYKGTKPNTVAFGVCTLIFLSLVGGILLLCADKDK